MNIAYKISLLVVMFAGYEAEKLNAASAIQHSTLQQINSPTTIITFSRLLPNPTVVPIAESRPKAQLNTYMGITERAIPSTPHLTAIKEAAAKKLKHLEQEKIEREGPSIKCPNQQCLFEGHEWFFEGCNPCFCPKQITAGQTVYYCDTCHQAFHFDCIANWRKQWAITAAEGCPNPKCSNQNKSLLACTVFNC